MSDDICGYDNTTTGEPCRHPAGSCPVPSHNGKAADGGNPQGRNTKLTKERQEGMAAMIEQGHSQAAAARAYGISPQTFTEWKRRGEANPETIFGEFSERIARALSTSEADYVNTLRHMAEEIGDTNTLRWMLQQRFHEEWGESDAIGGGDTQPVINLPESVTKEWQRHNQ